MHQHQLILSDPDTLDLEIVLVLLIISATCSLLFYVVYAILLHLIF